MLRANHIAGYARHVYIKQLYSSLRGQNKETKKRQKKKEENA